MSESKISYFQSSPKRSKVDNKKGKASEIKIEKGEVTTNSEIKKLLDGLIASKNSFEERRQQNYD